MNCELFIAQLLPVDTPAISPAIWDFFLVGGVIIGLAIVIFIVTAISRKKKSKRRRKRGPEILRNSETLLREHEAGEPTDGRREKLPRKKRRHHGESQQTLPTLAESGGLPPVRDKDSPPNTGP